MSALPSSRHVRTTACQHEDVAKLLSESSQVLLDGLRRWVDPVVAQAGFTWNESGREVDSAGRLNAVLYEAGPLDFVTRYPRATCERVTTLTSGRPRASTYGLSSTGTRTGRT